MGGLPRLTRLKTGLINDCVLESNKEVTEALNHVWSLTSLTRCANDEMHRLAKSSQHICLPHQQGEVTTVTELMSDHKNCLNLHSSNLLGFHLIQTAACQHTQRTMTPVYDWAKHRAAHSINLWQTETCCEQSVNQWKDCGLTMNQYSELYDMCAEQWQPWQHTHSPTQKSFCCVYTSEGPAQDGQVSVHRSHLQTGLHILSTGL